MQEVSLRHSEVDPKLGIGPVLTDCSSSEILRNVRTRKEVTVSSLKGNHAVHEEVRPGHVHLIADMGLGITGLREDVDTLACSIPVILGIGKIEVGVPYFDMIIRRETSLEVS